MQAAGVAYKRSVRLFRERRLQLPKHTHFVFLLHVASGVNLQCGRNYLGKLPDTVGDYLGLVAEQRAKIAQVALSDAPKSDHQYLHRFAPKSKPAACNWLSTSSRLCRIHGSSFPASPRAICMTKSPLYPIRRS